jgi:hypothetical protein
MSCPDQEICLVQSRGKPMTQTCEGNSYSPLMALQSILEKYEPAINVGGGGGENERRCYEFDRAWLIIIRDIHKRFNEGSKTKINEQMVIQAKKSITEITSVNDIPSIYNLFLEIKNIATAKFTDDSDSDSVKNLLDKYDELLGNEGFRYLSKKIQERINNLDKLDEDLNQIKHVTPAQWNKVINPIKDLFDLTLPIMNNSDDLENSRSDFDTKFNNVINLFNQLGSPSSGGNKKTRKRRKTNRRKTPKGNKRKTKRKAQKGGDFGASAGAIVIYIVVVLIFWLIAKLFSKNKH